MKTKLFRGYGNDIHKQVGVALSKVSCWREVKGTGMKIHHSGTEITMDNGITVLVGNSAVDVANAVEAHNNKSAEALDGNVTARA